MLHGIDQVENQVCGGGMSCNSGNLMIFRETHRCFPLHERPLITKPMHGDPVLFLQVEEFSDPIIAKLQSLLILNLIIRF